MSVDRSSLVGSISPVGDCQSEAMVELMFAKSYWMVELSTVILLILTQTESQFRPDLIRPMEGHVCCEVAWETCSCLWRNLAWLSVHHKTGREQDGK